MQTWPGSLSSDVPFSPPSLVKPAQQPRSSPSKKRPGTIAPCTPTAVERTISPKTCSIHQCTSPKGILHAPTYPHASPGNLASGTWGWHPLEPSMHSFAAKSSFSASVFPIVIRASASPEFGQCAVLSFPSRQKWHPFTGRNHDPDPTIPFRCIVYRDAFCYSLLPLYPNGVTVIRLASPLRPELGHILVICHDFDKPIVSPHKFLSCLSLSFRTSEAALDEHHLILPPLLGPIGGSLRCFWIFHRSKAHCSIYTTELRS